MRILVKVLYNANDMAKVNGHKDGDIFMPVLDLVIVKHNPTVEYINETLPQEIFMDFNGLSSGTTSIEGGFGNKSMSRGDALQIDYNGFSQIQVVEEFGWKLLA